MKTLCDKTDYFDAFEDPGLTLNAFAQKLDLDNTYSEPRQLMSIQREESSFYGIFPTDPAPIFGTPVNFSLEGNWDCKISPEDSASKVARHDCSTEISDCISIESFVQDILTITPKNGKPAQGQERDIRKKSSYARSEVGRAIKKGSI